MKDDSAHDARDKLVQLAEERIKVLNLKAKDLAERESERLKAQYEDAKRALVEDIDLFGLTGLTELPPRNQRSAPNTPRDSADSCGAPFGSSHVPAEVGALCTKSSWPRIK